MGENFQRVEHVWGEKCRESGCVEDCKEDCRALPGYTVPLDEVKRVALFHYVTRCCPTGFTMPSGALRWLPRDYTEVSASAASVIAEPQRR